MGGKAKKKVKEAVPSVFKGTFLYYRLMTNVFIVLSYITLSPFESKLRGVYLSVSAITVVLLLESISGMISYIFKKFKDTTLLWSLITSDFIVLGFIINILAGGNQYVSLIGLISVNLTQNILGPALIIQMQDLVSKRFPDKYKDYMFSVSFYTSFGKTLVLMFVLAITSAFGDKSGLWFGLLLTPISVYYQFRVMRYLKTGSI